MEKQEKQFLKWGLSNAVTYDIKTEAILFSKARSKRVKKEIAAIRLVFGEQGAKFNDKATRWLGVLYGLTHIFHSDKRKSEQDASS